ncbi:MAG: hypothetical protein LKK60_05105 [Bifidobacterium tibiigranuli]|uniref:hypothetical protein n=1 Tax=Bifidobacterium tibiigranuli TaxID=2172043 RepID=UPI0026EF764C|nr:hypothetical protein [Bifidobacterium tibiigranuli]MCI2185603.1 hypothetical protein [Bifidobacterium tibiigranuli]
MVIAAMSKIFRQARIWDFLFNRVKLGPFALGLLWIAIIIWTLVFLFIFVRRYVWVLRLENELPALTSPKSIDYHPDAFRDLEQVKEIRKNPWGRAIAIMVIVMISALLVGMLKLPFFDTTQEAAARVAASEAAAAKSLKAGDCVSFYPSSMLEENLVPTQVTSHLVSCSSDNAMLEITSLASSDSLKASQSLGFKFAIAALPASVQGFTYKVKPQVGQYFYGFIPKTDKNNARFYADGGKTKIIPQWVKADQKRTASEMKLPASSITPAYWRVTALKTNSADCTGGYLEFGKDEAVSPPYACVDWSNPSH